MNISIRNVLSFFNQLFPERKTNPLSKEFNSYLKNDIHLALKMIKHGYKITEKEQKILDEKLMKEAKDNVNFLLKNSVYHQYIPKDAFFIYMTHHNLGKNCDNDKSIFDNINPFLKDFFHEAVFCDELVKQLQDNILIYGKKVARFSPKYRISHAFTFNKKQQLIYNRFAFSCYNAIVLMPYIVKNMAQFVELKFTIQQRIEYIHKLVNKHNVRFVDLNGNTTEHYHENNCKWFQMNVLKAWHSELNKYDTAHFERILLEKTETLYQLNNELLDNKKDDISAGKQELDTTHESIEKLKLQLNQEQSNIVSAIQQYYQYLMKASLEKSRNYEICQTYQDLLKVMNIFINIHQDCRSTLKNIDDKTPVELINDSLHLIQGKFQLYLQDYEQNKVTDLSATERKIRMKNSM